MPLIDVIMFRNAGHARTCTTKHVMSKLAVAACPTLSLRFLLQVMKFVVRTILVVAYPKPFLDLIIAHQEACGEQAVGCCKTLILPLHVWRLMHHNIV